MDRDVLKKKLSTFRSGKSGRIMNVSDDLHPFDQYQK